MHKGFGGSDRRYRLDRIIDVLRDTEADLICLQEVDQNVDRTNHDDQPRILVERLKASAFVYQLNVPCHKGGYGNLIVSRWPILSQEHVCLRMGWWKPRGAQLVVVNTPQGPLHLVNWHLGLRERERLWQARELLHHPAFTRSEHLPTLVTGDFNDWRHTLETHAFARHHFHHATGPTRHFRSFPSFMALMSLDKLFHRGNVKIDEANIVRNWLTKKASDHLPLVVDFHLPRRGSV